MSNQFKELSASRTWSVLAGAATFALRRAGLAPRRLPGRGRSNIWEVEENGRRKRVSIRTTRDRWFAFPPLKKGTKWKTLDDVDVVVVAAVDDRDDPRNVEVYRFDADEVRNRFRVSHAARIAAGQTVRDDFGMWLNLDDDHRGLPASVGAGLGTTYPPIASFPLGELINAEPPETPEDDDAGAGAAIALEPHTIGEVLDWARRHVATLSGVRVEAVKLDCRIET